MKTITVSDHPATSPWSAMERALAAGAGVVLPPAVVAEVLADYARLVEKSNAVVRESYAPDPRPRA